MNPLFLIAIIMLPLLWRLFTNYMSGLAWALYLLTALSAYLLIETGGTLPNFTVHRIILFSVLIASIKAGKWRNKISLPHKAVIILYAAITILPLLFSIDKFVSFKSYLAFTVENVLFFIIVNRSLASSLDARILIKSAALALGTVGLLAIIERYTGYNPVDALLKGYVRKPQYVGDVMATFPHRILMGTALAMGWALALALAHEAKKQKWIWWIAMILMLMGCYFSFSRGPWIAAIFSGIIMYLKGGVAIRRMSRWVIILAIVAFIARPGVWETIHSRVQDTQDVNSFKGQTYQYRWELWGIAWKKISPDMGRTLFGYGQGSSELMKIETTLAYTHETYSTWSWDNHYAATMLETGLLGLAALCLLYGSIAHRQWILLSKVPESDRCIMASLFAAMIAILFMMSNVAIFAPQLLYLFWALAAAGIRIGMDSILKVHPATREVSYV